MGKNLAYFVIQERLEGVNLEYEDNSAMKEGRVIPWLIEPTSHHAAVSTPRTCAREYRYNLTSELLVLSKYRKQRKPIAWSPGPPNFSMLSACNIEKLGGPGDEARKLNYLV